MSQATSKTTSTPTPPTLSYYTVRPNHNTLENDKIRAWVGDHLPEGRIFNACAGKTKLNHPNITRNDLGGGVDIDTQEDVCDLSALAPNSFDCIIYDPPYGPNVADRVYNSDYPGYGTDVKAEFHRILKPGGVFIQLGWTGVGMPAQAYDRSAVAIFNLLGTQRDWIGTVDIHQPDSQSLGFNTEFDWKPYDKVSAHTVKTNVGDGPRTADGTTTELDVSVSYPDSPLPEKPLEHPTIREIIESHLDLTGIDRQILVPILCGPVRTTQPITTNDGHIETTLTGFTQQYSPDTRIPITEIAEHYTNAFDAIVFAPPESYFSRCLFENGENQGKVDALAREAFDTVLRPGGVVIQVGHTATNMPGKKDYNREAVHLIAPIAESDFTTGDGKRKTPNVSFISVDRKPGESSAVSVQGKHLPCLHCGEVFPAEPIAANVGCNTCSVGYNSYCRNPDSGQFLMTSSGEPIFHQSRWESLREIAGEIKSGTCPNSPYGTHMVKPKSGIYLPGFNTDYHHSLQ